MTTGNQKSSAKLVYSPRDFDGSRRVWKADPVSGRMTCIGRLMPQLEPGGKLLTRDEFYGRTTS